MLQHLPNWVPPVSPLSRCPWCCLLYLLAHTSAVTCDEVRLRAVPSHCFQNWKELGLLHSPEQQQPAMEELQQLRICSPGITQILADSRKSQNKKAWLQAWQSCLLGVSLQKCVLEDLDIHSSITRCVSTAQGNTEKAFLAWSHEPAHSCLTQCCAPTCFSYLYTS